LDAPLTNKEDENAHRYYLEFSTVIGLSTLLPETSSTYVQSVGGGEARFLGGVKYFFSPAPRRNFDAHYKNTPHLRVGFQLVSLFNNIKLFPTSTDRNMIPNACVSVGLGAYGIYLDGVIGVQKIYGSENFDAQTPLVWKAEIGYRFDSEESLGSGIVAGVSLRQFGLKGKASQLSLFEPDNPSYRFLGFILGINGRF
jgi:hypothetical protein